MPTDCLRLLRVDIGVVPALGVKALAVEIFRALVFPFLTIPLFGGNATVFRHELTFFGFLASGTGVLGAPSAFRRELAVEPGDFRDKIQFRPPEKRFKAQLATRLSSKAAPTPAVPERQLGQAGLLPRPGHSSPPVR